MAGTILVERTGPQGAEIAYVTLYHASKLNAINIGMWRQLRATFEQLSTTPEPRCIVVRGAGGHFAAGADIEEFPEFRFDIAGLREYHEDMIAPALKAIYRCDVPVVAQIDGVCVGGGLEIAACCDIRICGTSSRFGAPIAKLGFPMAPDELEAVLRVAGRATVLELLLEARVFDAATALQRGLVHRVVADTQVAGEAQATAERIAALAPLAARINKQTLRAMEHGGLSVSQRGEHFRYGMSHDHREGVIAFLEKRPANFTGD